MGIARDIVTAVCCVLPQLSPKPQHYTPFIEGSLSLLLLLLLDCYLLATTIDSRCYFFLFNFPFTDSKEPNLPHTYKHVTNEESLTIYNP